MKKWLSVIGSGLFGILTYCFMGITAIKIAIDPTMTALLGESKTYNGYQLLTDSDLKTLAQDIDSNALIIYRVFAIILLVMAGLAIVYAILKTLANLNVIKLPKCVDSALAGIAIDAIAAVICVVVFALIFRSDCLSTYADLGVGDYVTMPIYPGLILVLVETVVLTIAGTLSALGKKKA